MDSYKFTKFNNAPKFFKDLEHLHFGEKEFHWNDSQGKVASYKSALTVNFEYADYVEKEEEMYRNIYSMTTWKNQLKLKILAAGIKAVEAAI